MAWSRTQDEDDDDDKRAWIGKGQRAVEIVLCNNNWTAVSFHLDTIPAPIRIPRPREDEKEEEGFRVTDGEGVDNPYTAMTTEMILVRRRVAAVARVYKEPRLGPFRFYISLFLDPLQMLEVSCAGIHCRSLVSKNDVISSFKKMYFFL